MGFFRNYVNKKIDELKLDVQDKGYLANLIVDHVKSKAMDASNPGYGVQVNPVTKAAQCDNRFMTVVNESEPKALTFAETTEQQGQQQKTIQITKSKVQAKPVEPDIFAKIVGHEPLKSLLKSTMAKVEGEGVLLHTLLLGAPGGAKSIFLECIRDAMPKKCFYIVGTHATKAAINEYLYSHAGQVKYVLIDELDKMKPEERQGLLDIMSSGRVTETKMHRTRSEAVNVSIIAAANDISDFSRELKSRFFTVQVKDYTLAEFKLIARSTFKAKFSQEIADYLAAQVWDVAGSRDFRDVIKIGDRVTTKEEIDTYITFMI